MSVNALKSGTSGGAPTLPPGAPDWVAAADNPYLQGLYAPLANELAGEVCEVEGTLPPDLEGIYLRNGPNPGFAPPNRYHWFDGDAMIHGLVIRDGRATYTNRWIETAGRLAERDAGRAIWPGLMGPFDFSLPGGPLKDTANTDLVYFNGRVLALWYHTGQPYAVDPVSLATKGRETLDGTLPFPISAHAHVDELTGEMLLFSFGERPPYMKYGVVSADGKLIHQTPIELPGPRVPHDMGFTANYSILHDLPFFHDIEILRTKKRRVATFYPDMPARFAVVPRFGSNADVRWFDAKPCYVLHIVNCWEDGDWIVMDGYRSADPKPKPDAADGELASMLAYLRLEANFYRWEFNLKTGETRERDIDDLNAEFPSINRAWGGQRTRYSYAQHIPHERTLSFKGLVKYDNQTGRREMIDYGEGVYGSEAPFAPRTGATEEDDGYLVSFTTRIGDWRSECQIFDARNIENGPICRVKLPQRLPAGFHATWIRGDQLWS
ncbi:MAG: carotenoid oxygenase family protein [Rhodobacteraceae bacterium]|nr:carotenoid oxygenase family protein [Paracoccaceae bacterium]